MKKTAFLYTAAVVLALVLFLLVSWKGNMHVDVRRDGLAYVVGYCQGLGPKKLDYAEHSEAIDQLIRMVNGDYRRIGRWSNIGFSGGGPYSIQFYRQGEAEPYATVLYVDGNLAAARSNAGRFELYVKKDEVVSFAAFETYLKDNGTT